MTSATTTAGLEESIRKLEKQVHRLTALLGLLFLMTLVLLAWRLLPGERAVAAHNFLVRDANGVKRAELGLERDGSPALRLNNPSGRPRILMLLRPDGSALCRLMDEQARNRAELSLEKDGSPRFELAGRDGRTRVALGVGPDDTPEAVVRDAALRATWSAPEHAHGD